MSRECLARPGARAAAPDTSMASSSCDWWSLTWRKCEEFDKANFHFLSVYLKYLKSESGILCVG